jgi:exodeoxyribonuclease VII small subunit
MKPEKNFETAISELEEIVRHLEQGDLSLENALKKFEQGIELSKFCQRALTEAQSRIEELKQSNDKPHE